MYWILYIKSLFCGTFDCVFADALGDVDDGIVAFQLQGDGRGTRVSVCLRLEIAAPGSLPFAHGKLSETFRGALPGSFAATRRCRRPYNSTTGDAAAIAFRRWVHASKPESGSR
jgi:hypothetical protein